MFGYKETIGSVTFTFIEEDSFLTYITTTSPLVPYTVRKTELIEKAILEIKEYFEGKRKTFDLKIRQQLTEFEKEVFNETSKIPYGEVLTYGQLAERIGKGKAYRAVGNALHKNNCLIVMPCHRVVAKDSIGGFGAGKELKKRLLSLEGRTYE